MYHIFFPRNIGHELFAKVAHSFELEKIEMAQNSNHFCLEFNFSSDFEPSENFRTCEPLWQKQVTGISRTKC